MFWKIHMHLSHVSTLSLPNTIYTLSHVGLFVTYAGGKSVAAMYGWQKNIIHCQPYVTIHSCDNFTWQWRRQLYMTWQLVSSMTLIQKLGLCSIFHCKSHLCSISSRTTFVSELSFENPTPTHRKSTYKQTKKIVVVPFILFLFVVCAQPLVVAHSPSLKFLYLKL